MRLAKRHTSNVPPVDMTPMIDVVMLLLIFFMTVTQISQAVELPPEKGTEGQQISTVVVSIYATGTMRAEVKKILGDGRELSEEQEVDRRILGDVLDYQVARAGGDAALVRVLIRADHRAPSGAVSGVVSLLQERGIKAVRFAVRE